MGPRAPPLTSERLAGAQRHALAQRVLPRPGRGSLRGGHVVAELEAGCPRLPGRVELVVVRGPAGGGAEESTGQEDGLYYGATPCCGAQTVTDRSALRLATDRMPAAVMRPQPMVVLRWVPMYTAVQAPGPGSKLHGDQGSSCDPYTALHVRPDARLCCRPVKVCPDAPSTSGPWGPSRRNLSTPHAQSCTHMSCMQPCIQKASGALLGPNCWPAPVCPA